MSSSFVITGSSKHSSHSQVYGAGSHVSCSSFIVFHSSSGSSSDSASGKSCCTVGFPTWGAVVLCQVNSSSG
ncbi:hypothetical protein IKO50_02785 [bacterium]|nr:hypothetical protein [bacterium]